MVQRAFVVDSVPVMNRWLRRYAERRRRAQVAAAAAYMAVLTRRDRAKGWRGRMKIRTRMVWKLRVAGLDDIEFVQRYRLTKRAFKMVADGIRGDCEPDHAQSRRGGGGNAPITTELQLSMVLRYLAGGAWQDIVDLHGVSRPSFSDAITRVFTFVNATLMCECSCV